MQEIRLSYSSLKAFLKSPNHYLLYKSGMEPTDAMRKGTAVDEFILTPHKFKENYHVLDESEILTQLSSNKNPRATKVYKEWLAMQPDKVLLTVDEYEELKKIRASVLSTTNILEGTDRQVELTGKIGGITFRGFADAIGDAVIELKTTKDASPNFFMRQAYNLKYHLQTAIYLELSGKSDYFIIAVEKDAPYNCQVYALSKDLIQAGRELLYDGIEKIKQWNGQPEGYSPHVQLLDLPRWAK